MELVARRPAFKSLAVQTGTPPRIHSLLIATTGRILRAIR
jgi:hypothetical protein